MEVLFCLQVEGDKLTSLALSQTNEEPLINAILSALLSTEGSEICMQSAAVFLGLNPGKSVERQVLHIGCFSGEN